MPEGECPVHNYKETPEQHVKLKINFCERSWHTFTFKILANQDWEPMSPQHDGYAFRKRFYVDIVVPCVLSSKKVFVLTV